MLFGSFRHSVLRWAAESGNFPGNYYSVGGAVLFSSLTRFWLSGKCNRNHCRFLHPGLPKLQPSSSEDHRRNKFTYSLKNDASVFGVNDVTMNPKQVLIADEKSSPVLKSKNELMNASVVPSSVTEHKSGRIITLKKRSASPKVDENHVNHKKVLTLQRSSPVVLQSKNVTAPSSNVALKSEAKSAVEKVLADERIGPVVQSKSVKVP
ncbi:OLC1v1024929C1 [Oldenlandia corymbosa var. corymbosa]|uniref:OLC1v1024929C1 n=1 Tax=Oldenlandia corymbosa var. corymbosa TaxID=529605 RepID=A0AAV1C585_OLDCO|nr:OLC1v1024929C1 [Oldenlandia corymbosa var. corymbosa]